MDTQTRLPPALAALHNFIRKHDPDDINDFDDVEDEQPGTRTEEPAREGQLADGLAGVAERRQASDRRDRIAQELWAGYQAELRRRNNQQ
jgi:hypothetical protein